MMADSTSTEVEEKEIFISYGREPEVNSFVRQLKRNLEEAGFTVWLDLEDIPAGSDWHGAIGTGLHKCRVILPVITRKYIGSRYCINELYTADGDKKLIFPVVFEDVEFADTETGRGVKFVISSINWTMCRPGIDDYSSSIQKLVQGMREKGVGEGQAMDSSPSSSGAAHNAITAVCTVGPISNTPLKMIPDLESPQHIAVGLNGEIVVASYQGHKVFVYSKDYNLVTEFGGQGFVDGKFLCPSGIAIDDDNHILVSSINKIQKFTIDGMFVDAVGEQGKGELQFNCPNAVAIGKEGRIYVAEMMNNRVQILNSDLTYHGSFSKASPTLGSGRLSQPQALAINSEGMVFVADTMNHAVQAFSPDGEFLFRFGKHGAGTTPGVTTSPMSIAVDPDDYIYVGSAGGPISIFDRKGEFVRTFGSYGSELGQFNLIRGMLVDRFGYLYVCEWTSNRIQIFQGPPAVRARAENEASSVRKAPKPKTDDMRRPAYTIGPKSTTPIKILPDIESPQGIATGKNGELVVTRYMDHEIRIYDKNFDLVVAFSREEESTARVLCPFDVAIDDNNDILLVSCHKLCKFTMRGELVEFIEGNRGLSGKEQLQFDGPHSIAIGNEGRIYISESGNKRIQILNKDLSFLKFAANPHLNKRSKDSPEGIAINSEGKIYLVDSGNNNVQVYSPSGEYLFKFGKEGDQQKRGTLYSPNVIAIDKNDYVYVGCHNTISIFDKEGEFIRAFGGYGEEPGQFALIRGLHIDEHGMLYVCEWKTDRIQIFSLQ